jgi:hypothetical protein
MKSSYREYFWKDEAHLLELDNCESCDIQILATERLCDTCRVLLVDNDEYQKQKNLWIKCVYLPWRRKVIDL